MNDIISTELRKGRSYFQMVEDYKRAILEEAMSQAHGNKCTAARILKVHRNNLGRWTNETFPGLGVK